MNDGIDNQCPGDAGFGLIDEISGISGFFSTTDRDELSWPPQSNATLYEAARSSSSDYSTDCLLEVTVDTKWVDGRIPPTTAVFYYLSRAAAPNVGSWGESSSGIERTFVCPFFSADLFILNGRPFCTVAREWTSDPGSSQAWRITR